ncbi:hypothetical protein E2C01_043265 [Portunus trituberculatus]|uniref:Uncharacterized protein n=1 Tax=Portunus trituberculatus TaxID=210409 RepID=A0A5B7FZ31_PORTR|nr:hypothetical protein [Portunus trituberculatus]
MALAVPWNAPDGRREAGGRVKPPRQRHVQATPPPTAPRPGAHTPEGYCAAGDPDPPRVPDDVTESHACPRGTD